MNTLIFDSSELRGHSAAFADHFIRLSRESNRLRFFNFRSEFIIKEWVHSLTSRITSYKDFWIVYQKKNQFVAVGQLACDFENLSAEIALSIDDDLQLLGYGKKMMSDLIFLAREQGIKFLNLTIMAQNTKMIAVASFFDFVLKHEDGEIVGFLELKEEEE